MDGKILFDADEETSKWLMPWSEQVVAFLSVSFANRQRMKHECILFCSILFYSNHELPSYVGSPL